MKVVSKICMLLLLPAFLAGNITFASDSGRNALFKIGRSKDANEIYYQAQTTEKGVLDTSNPINIYWIKVTKGDAIKPLTPIQQNFAYGLKFLDVTPDKADFHFVSYKKRTLSLRKCSTGDFKVFTKIEGKEVEIERIFIQIDGGTFWVPKISRVELHAKLAEGNENIVEIIRP